MRGPVTLLAIGAACLLAPAALAAQARPSGSHRPWLEASLGVAREDQHCSGCVRNGTIGGLTLSGAAGITVTPRFGVAVLARGFQQISFENSQSSRYVVALGQYIVSCDLACVTINGGGGLGTHHGDQSPYGNSGSGGVIAAGLAIRVPSRTSFALSFTGDWIQSVSGSRSATGGQPEAPYRPSLLTVGVGLSFARPIARLQPPNE